MSDVRLPPVRILPTADPRVETGAIAFGSDWPGTFIRGDNAAYYAAHLRTVLFGDNMQPEYFFSRQVIYGLLSDLESSNLTTRSDPEPAPKADVEREPDP